MTLPEIIIDWKLPVWTLVNTVLILTSLAAVTRKLYNLSEYLADHHRAMNDNQTAIIEQIRLTKIYAVDAATISQRTDDRIKDAPASADNAAAVLVGQTIQSKIDALPVKIADEIRQQAMSDSGHLTTPTITIDAGTVNVTPKPPASTRQFAKPETP